MTNATDKTVVDAAPPARPVSAKAARRGLFTPRHPGAVYTREQLVSLARAGVRGFRFTAPVALTADDPMAAARHLSALRDAAGVGLRTIWQGSVTGIPTDLLHHLDPPRGSDRALLWPVPRGPLLTLRHGPAYLQVEDHRGGAGMRRVLIDAPHQVRVLSEPHLSCADESELSDDELAGIRALADQGLFLRIGSVWFALPVRFRYARG
ncbi:DUF5825 family protein [Streptomyces sp. AM2-3-1]|uniref:DUF5825 family protein n=1 Tax=Streptomyces sp. AM2-3-1 TaxID=3075824 RepID=UPI0028C46978|nr:DUF5825 family protein [Streptomyces sp. AM2-3-1]WNO67454.1 DUF5825 family protein [Streptomyces sp. AM2-3-1]